MHKGLTVGALLNSYRYIISFPLLEAEI